jgi:dTDP-4-dehydrorhamnose reductase
MKILITGATGLVGSQVTKYFKTQNQHTLLTPTSTELNISIHEQVMNYMHDHKPHAIVHCAGYTDVTKAEKERDNTRGQAWLLNVEATRSVVEAAEQHNLFLIHISTDMVFPGSSTNRGPYTEKHPPEIHAGNLSWYGWTKAAAEEIVNASSNHAAIVRISNPVGKKHETRVDYVHKLLNAYEQKKPVALFGDQYLTLSSIQDLAVGLEKILDRKQSGVHHISSNNIFTPFELGTYLLSKRYGVNDVILKTSIEDFLMTPGNATRYPRYGGLDVRTTYQNLTLQSHSWQEIIDAILQSES